MLDPKSYTDRTTPCLPGLRPTYPAALTPAPQPMEAASLCDARDDGWENKEKEWACRFPERDGKLPLFVPPPSR